MIEKTILSLMPETLTDQFDFKGVYVDAKGISHSLTVYDTSYFYLNVLSQYASRKVMVPEEGSEAFFLAGSLSDPLTMSLGKRTAITFDSVLISVPAGALLSVIT